MFKKFFVVVFMLTLFPVMFLWAGAEKKEAAIEAGVGMKKFEDVTIWFFCGGEAGDAFASIVYRGAQDAEKALGVDVKYVFSGWNVEKMVAQLRDAIAARPDGIAFMGHSGDEAIIDLIEEATEAGILMMYQNVDVPEVRKKFGGGYVGSNLYPQGRALGEEAIRTFGLRKGNRVIVFGAWGQPGRFFREEGTANVFEEAGIIVDRITAPPEAAAAPELLTPLVTGAVMAHPEVKLICYAGGQHLGNAPAYMEALGKKPGEIINIGFDVSPAVIDAFRKGYVQLTSDQQPYLQGAIPILSLALTKVYGFGPMSLDTGAGFVTVDNFEDVAALAEAGIR